MRSVDWEFHLQQLTFLVNDLHLEDGNGQSIGDLEILPERGYNPRSLRSLLSASSLQRCPLQMTNSIINSMTTSRPAQSE